MLYLPLTVLLLLPFFSFANHAPAAFNHKMVKPTGKEKQVKDSKAKLQSIIGTYPTNPTFATFETYGDTSCKTKMGATTQLLDTCFTSGTVSEKYTCSGTTLTYNSYSDSSCTTIDTTLTVGSTCTTVSVDGMNFGGIVSNCGGSTEGSWGSGNFVTDSYYETSTCYGEMTASYGTINGYCFDNGDGTSWKYSWPNMKFYASSSTCSGSADSTPIDPRTCTLWAGDGTDDTNVGSYEVYTYSGASTNKVLGFGFIAFFVFAMGYLF